MTWVAGLDAFKRGWRAVFCDTASEEWTMLDVKRFSEALAFPQSPAIICVDMPIGLPDVTPPGGRACEAAARIVLGPRRLSVFSAVGREALSAAERSEADVLSRSRGGIGISAHAWGLAAKLREVDSVMSVSRQAGIFEVHPELCFCAMNDCRPMTHNKKSGSGQNERAAVLGRNGVPKEFLNSVLSRLPSGHDDFLDACAAAWTARRIHAGVAGRVPAHVERDSKGLDMAMWY